MIAYASFLNSLRLALRDRAQWTDSQLGAWVEDGLEEYSAIFPRRNSVKFAASAAVRQYDLANKAGEEVYAVLAVEYPAGQQPRRFLTQLDEREAAFLGGAYYAVSAQVKAASTSSPYPYLVLGESPPAGEYIFVEYLTRHTTSAPDQPGALSVPEHHLPIIRQYCAWKALEQQLNDALAEVERKPEMVSALSQALARAELAYRRRLELAARADSQSQAVSWAMPGVDRVY